MIRIVDPIISGSFDAGIGRICTVRTNSERGTF